MDSGLRSGKNRASKGFEKSVSPNIKLKQQYNPGDIAWIKNRDNSWWPVQVVDVLSTVGKAKKKKSDEILVRSYGNCDYLYADPSRFSVEFENYIKLESISAAEIIQKALEKDLHHISGGNSKRKFSKSKEISSTKTRGGKKQKQEMARNDQKADNSPPHGPSSTKQDEETRKHHEKVVDAVDEEEAEKSTTVVNEKERVVDAVAKEEESEKSTTVVNEKEPNANSVKVNFDKKQKNKKSGMKAIEQTSLRRSRRTTVKDLTPEIAEGKSLINSLENQVEKLTNGTNQLNTGKSKQEEILEQMRRTDEEIRKMIMLELAKHRREQASKSLKTGNPEPTKKLAPEDTPNARKIRVMQNLGLMAPTASPYSKKRKG